MLVYLAWQLLPFSPKGCHSAADNHKTAPELERQARFAGQLFNLQVSEWNSALMITLKTETCHDWWQLCYCLWWHPRLALRQLLVLSVATKLRIMTTRFSVQRCSDIYEQWAFWKKCSWMRHTLKYSSVLNISNLPSLPMCTFGIHPRCWKWNLLTNMINWYYGTYIHTSQDFFPC